MSAQGENRILHGEHIMLRPVTGDDTEQIVAWRNKDDVRSHFVFRKTLTKEEHLRWLKEQVETGLVEQFMICEKKHVRETDGAREDDAAFRDIGSVYLRDIDQAKGTAEFGILIGEEDARGKGYGKEACRTLLAYGFETLGLKRIGLRVYCDNLPAITTYQEAGFTVREMLKDVVSTDGTKADMYWMEAHARDGL